MSALHNFLVDFDLDRAAEPRPIPLASTWLLAGLPPPPGAALDALVEPAVDPVAEAVAAALAEAASDHAAAIAALQAQHAERLAAERAGWAEAEGKALAEAIRCTAETIETLIADAAAAVLEPLVGAFIRHAAVADLRVALGELVTSGTGAAIAIAGPEDLLAALREALGPAGIATDGMTFTGSDATEVTVKADSSTIETRLGDWARGLQRRIGHPE